MTFRRRSSSRLSRQAMLGIFWGMILSGTFMFTTLRLMHHTPSRAASVAIDWMVQQPLRPVVRGIQQVSSEGSGLSSGFSLICASETQSDSDNLQYTAFNKIRKHRPRTVKDELHSKELLLTLIITSKHRNYTAATLKTWAHGASHLVFLAPDGNRLYWPEAQPLLGARVQDRVHGVYIALEALCRKSLDEYQWFMLVTSEAYVDLDVLKQTLGHFPAAHPIIFGHDNCAGVPRAANTCISPPSLVLSRALVQQMCPLLRKCSREASPDADWRQHVQGCARSSVAMTCGQNTQMGERLGSASGRHIRGQPEVTAQDMFATLGRQGSVIKGPLPNPGMLYRTHVDQLEKLRKEADSTLSSLKRDLNNTHHTMQRLLKTPEVANVAKVNSSKLREKFQSIYLERSDDDAVLSAPIPDNDCPTNLLQKNTWLYIDKHYSLWPETRFGHCCVVESELQGVIVKLGRTALERLKQSAYRSQWSNSRTRESTDHLRFVDGYVRCEPEGVVKLQLLYQDPRRPTTDKMLKLSADAAYKNTFQILDLDVV